jgi:hypothetical protein
MNAGYHATGFRLAACGLWLAALAAVLPAAQWTVMVYMCADNGMSDQSYIDLAEMTRAGSTDAVSIIAQVDRPEYDSLPRPRRYQVASGRLELLGEMPELDMADPANLADFVRFCRNDYPADKYLLVLWDHGNGWPESLAAKNRDCPSDSRLGNPGLSRSSPQPAILYDASPEPGTVPAISASEIRDCPKVPPQPAILYDASSGKALGVAGGGLREALVEVRNILGRKVGILAMDACLMQMIEVAWEVRDCAEVMVASEDLQPFNGFPYDTFFQTLVANPDLNAREYARLLPDLFARSYTGGSQGTEAVTLSSLDLTRLEPAVADLKAVLDTVSALAQDESSQRARREAQTFACEYGLPNRFNDNVDLADFLTRTNPARGRLLDRLVLASASNDPSLAGASGVAVWFPDNYLALKARHQEYAGLEFCTASGWLHFLNCFFAADEVKPSPVRVTAGRIGRRNDFRLNWSRSFDLAPVAYQVERVTEIVDVFNDPVENPAFWDTSGFTLQTFQGRSVFSSGVGDTLNSTLTLRTPLTVDGDALVSFSIWRNTRETTDTLGSITRDVCYLDVASPDMTRTRPEFGIVSPEHGTRGHDPNSPRIRYRVPGTPATRLTWVPVDSFYGFAPFWQRARLILRPPDNGWPDPGLQLRFRFRTCSGPHVAGVYLDSIAVQSLSPDWDMARTRREFGSVSPDAPGLRSQRLGFSPTPDTWRTVFNTAQGDAFYLVTPVDSFGNVGFVSEPVRVAVPDYAAPYSLPSPIVLAGGFATAQLVLDYPEDLTPDVAIFTLSGELVRRLPGVTSSRVPWDLNNAQGRPVAAGIYLVVVQAGGFSRQGCIAVVR